MDQGPRFPRYKPPRPQRGRGGQPFNTNAIMGLSGTPRSPQIRPRFPGPRARGGYQTRGYKSVDSYHTLASRGRGQFQSAESAGQFYHAPDYDDGAYKDTHNAYEDRYDSYDTYNDGHQENYEAEWQDYDESNTDAGVDYNTSYDNEEYNQSWSNEVANETNEPSTSQQENADDSESSEDDDTGYCKYCKTKFPSAKAYHAHTRGLQHTTLIMEAKQQKGDKHYQKEKVTADVLEVTIPAPRPVQPEPVEAEIEYDYEENWMNFDDDILAHMKTKKSASERDLNPDDIGKKRFDDDFSCPLCEIRCTGAVAFKMHVEGKQHKNNMESAEKGAKLRKKKTKVNTVSAVESTDRSSKFAEMAETMALDSPLLGLDYITEFQKPDIKLPQRYVCNLCETKCDGSTIFPHIVGLKHKLFYFRETNRSVYEHLTKYNSKKKKAELSISADELGRSVEEREGRKEVKVKIEFDAGQSEEDLKLTMSRTSMALQEKVERLEREAEEREQEIAAGGTRKRMKMSEHPGPSWRGRGRFPPPHDRGPPPPPRGYPPPRDPYADSYGPRSEPYRRYPVDDPYYDRYYMNEQRRLDDLLLERYRLSDPLMETRRLDDILDRKRRLDDQEKKRLDDILERRKRLEQNVSDVDRYRLERFRRIEEQREKTSESDRPRVAEANRKDTQGSERPSMEELVARRRAEFSSRLEERPRIDESLLPSKYIPAQPESQDPDPVPSSEPDMTVAQAAADKALQEEAANHPSVNVGELLRNLSSSMIASEDDPAMALQVSNALTQALLKYRLNSAPKELSDIAKSLQPILDRSSPQSKPIPGLGSSESSSNVPSYLRDPEQQSLPSKEKNYDLYGMNVTKSQQQQQQQPRMLINTSNIDQPQKLLLESIRQQTELLKQQITSSHGENSHSNTSTQAQSQMKHEPLPDTLQHYNPYRPPVPPTDVSSASIGVPAPMSTSANENPNSYNWYQQFHGVTTPNSAPGQPPLPVSAPTSMTQGFGTRPVQ